jgi:hypothetical protein
MAVLLAIGWAITGLSNQSKGGGSNDPMVREAQNYCKADTDRRAGNGEFGTDGSSPDFLRAVDDAYNGCFSKRMDDYRQGYLPAPK